MNILGGAGETKEPEATSDAEVALSAHGTEVLMCVYVCVYITYIRRSQCPRM